MEADTTGSMGCLHSRKQRRTNDYQSKGFGERAQSANRLAKGEAIYGSGETKIGKQARGSHESRFELKGSVAASKILNFKSVLFVDGYYSFETFLKKLKRIELGDQNNIL
mmetsp:Transcript_10931/g.27697  ORF Transcript_10931/g.27697 Transcript_10931/m.27697 type:complete len:110 (+) Transcript_10931:995-1324(+)